MLLDSKYQSVMDVNIKAEIKDGDSTHLITEAPSIADKQNQSLEGSVKKKRRRGKSKRKVTKPFMKLSWQERRKYEKARRNNRFRKIVLTKTHAPFNNNQFLMEIHKPEPENNFQLLRTPSARTRDSSFSVDSEENYFYSLPENEEEYLTKEFSSVYEDAQSERLSNMTKDDLIQEYLILEAKYENLAKRSERSKNKTNEDDQVNNSVTDSMVTDTSITSVESSVTDEPSIDEILQRMKEQEDQIQELQMANEKLRLENEHLRNKSSSSEDSESDSSSTSVSDSSSAGSASPVNTPMHNSDQLLTDIADTQPLVNGHNGVSDDADDIIPLVNGFHNDDDPVPHP